jgi:hypothetical protein
VSSPQPPDYSAVVRALIRANRELTDALERVVGPPALPSFIPTPFQQEILAALKGKGLRTDALVAKLECGRSRLYADPGGLPELQENGLVSHHKRVGYYRPDAPPTDCGPPVADQDRENAG